MRARDSSQRDKEEGGAAAKQQAPERRSTVQEMAALVEQGGWPALYRGLQTALVGTTVSQVGADVCSS